MYVELQRKIIIQQEEAKVREEALVRDTMISKNLWRSNLTRQTT